MPITVVTKEGNKVVLESRVASCFGMVTSIIDDIEETTAETELPIPEVDSETLKHITHFYSATAVESRPTDAAVSSDGTEDTSVTGETSEAEQTKADWIPWDPSYLADLEDEVFFKVFVACNYLEATKLLDVCAKWLADIVLECKTPDAIRARFNITTEPTEEESRMIADECNHIVSGYKA